MTAAEKRATKFGILMAFATAIIFGAYPPAMRGVYADGGNAAFMIIVTTWARAISMTGFCLATQKPLFHTREDTNQSVVGGLFQAFSVTGIAASLVFIPGPIMAIIVYTYALMLLFYTAARGETPLTLPTIITTIAAFAGLTLVLDIWNINSTLSLTGVALALMAALATTGRIYVFGKSTRARSPFVAGAESLIVTGLCVSLLALWQAPHLPQSMAGYGWTLVGCASLAIGSFSMFYGISLLGSFRWGLFSKVEPIFTSLFSVWFLGEILQWQQYLGILIVIGSLVLYQIFDQRRQKAAL